MRRIAFYGFWNKTMWRALFFAIGASLILLGVQCLVVDHIVVANGTRVPGFVAKYLDGRGGNKANGPSLPIGNPSQNSNPSFNQRTAGLTAPSQTARRTSLQPFSNPSSGVGSRFGPSRFADSQFSNADVPSNVNYYGGVPFSNRTSPNRNGQFSNGPVGADPQFSLAGYGGAVAPQTFNNAPRVSGLGGTGVGQGNSLSAVTLGKGGSRLLKPTEWMPWGLLAIGTLVVLYTNSTGRGFSKD